MKYLVLLLVLVVAFGFWKSRRNLAQPSRPHQPSPPTPQDMVACAHCGLHLPRTDAIVQYGAHYCCADLLRAGPSHR